MKKRLKIPNKVMVYLIRVFLIIQFFFFISNFKISSAFPDLDLNSEENSEEETTPKQLSLYVEYEITKLFDAAKACNVNPKSNLYFRLNYFLFKSNLIQ